MIRRLWKRRRFKGPADFNGSQGAAVTAKGGEDTVKTTAAPSCQEVYILLTDTTLRAKENEVF